MVRIQSRRGTATEWTSIDPTLALGEIGIEIDTYKMKVGTGSTLWNNLPYVKSEKQFQNIVTVSKDGFVGSADFICSDAVYEGDDAACIQAAIDYCSSNGITTLNFLEGSYAINSNVIISKNIRFVGIGDVIFNISSSELNTPVIQFTGSSVLTTTLASTADLNSITVSLTSATGVQVGDLLKIYKKDPDNLWSPVDYPDQMTGELYKVVSINSTTVTLSQPLLRQYLTAYSGNTTTVKIYRPVKIYLKNIKFIGPGITENIAGVSLTYCVNSTVKKCEFINIGRRSLLINTSYNVKIDNNYITGSCYPGTGYGVAISDACAIITVSKNTIENCRHTIMSGTSNYEGLNRTIKIINNTLVSGDVEDAHTIDAHPMTIDYLVDNNHIYPRVTSSGQVLYAFADGTVKSIFSNNYVCGGGGVRRRQTVIGDTLIENNRIEHTNGGSIYSYTNSGGQGAVLQIIGNHLYDCTSENTTSYGYGILIGRETYKHIEIVDNVFDTCSMHAIYAIFASGNNDSKVLINNNIVDNSGSHAVYIERVNTDDIIDIELCNNIITNTGLNVTVGDGIYVKNIDGAIISKNMVRSAYYGIAEGAGSNNNIITDNKISTCTVPVLKIGANTTVSNNPGYKTENSGNAIVATSGTSVVVTHGLAATPTRLKVTPGGNIGSCWVTSPTSTQFTINCSTAPEADTTVYWSAYIV